MSEGKPDTFEFFPDQQQQHDWGKRPQEPVTLVPNGSAHQRDHARPFESVVGVPHDAPGGNALGGGQGIVVGKDRMTPKSQDRLRGWWDDMIREAERRPEPAIGPPHSTAAGPQIGPCGIPVGPTIKPGRGGQLPGLKIPQGAK